MRAAPPISALVAPALVLAACASAPRSSRLAVDDVEFTAKELAAKLAASEFLAGRSADSPRMTVAIDKLENLTADVLPEREQWYLMARVRDSASMESLRRLRNIVFVVPVHRAASGATEFDREVASGRRPTHEMGATFHAAVRAAGQDRTDAYLCEMRITSLDTRELVWADSVEFKKSATGRAYD